MFLLAFHAFLRIGEITVFSSSSINQNLINLKQLTLHHLSGSLSVTFVCYKHKASLTPITLNIDGNQGQYNIAREMAHYIALRGYGDGPLFVYNNKPVTRSFFNNAFNDALKMANYNLGNYKTHSFRIGAATHCLIKGYSMEQIQQMGRWKSNAFQRYFRVSSFKL
jgi:hypothetical protein